MGDNTTLSCTPETLQRFNDIRQECKTDHTPAPTQNMMLQSLMDTWEKVNEQGYGGDEAPDTPDYGEELADLRAEVKRLREQVERVPDQTASKFGERYR